MGDASRTRVSVTRRTIGHGGQMTVGWMTVGRIPDGAVLQRDNQWGIPRKRALFVSDGPDSTTPGSDILEGHCDWHPEEEYSDIPKSGRPHDGYVAEGLCSKRALFVSDGPDSTTSGSDILEGQYDRPPEEEYSDIPKSG